MPSPSFWWILVGVLLMISEFAIPGIILFFFGLGALLTAVLSYFMPALSLSAELTIFLVSSLISLFTLRRFFKPIFKGTIRKHNEPMDEGLAGEEGVVTEAIEPGSTGKVALHGTSWKAEAAQSIEAGKTVEVVSQKSLTLIVKQK